MDEYRQVLTFPWQLEGNLGTRTFPIARGEQAIADRIPGLDDEAAEDPDDEDEELPPPVIEDLIPTAETVRKRTPPPPMAVVSAPATVPSTPLEAFSAPAEPAAAPASTIEQAGPPVPSLGISGPVTPGMEIDSDAAVETTETGEASAKRQKLSAMRVGADTLFHVDVGGDEYFQQLEEHIVSFPEELADAGMDCNWDTGDDNREMTEDDLWQPFSTLEPSLDAMTVEKIDNFADQVEIDRLMTMKVITTHEGYSGELGSQLSAKFVRSWRKKTRTVMDESGKVISETPGWLRRSRLVAREYNWMDIRDDVYSPPSSSSIVKVLPALVLSDGFKDNCILGTLDIGDAFLQVDQPVPRVV